MKSSPRLAGNLDERALALVPSAFFFTESVEVPLNLGSGELEDFAELSIEGMSPFPVEQLAWGFMKDAQRPRILLAAACRSRLKGEESQGWEAAEHALPGFISLLGLTQAEPVWVFLHEHASVTALYFEAYNPMPLHIQSQPAADESLDAAFEAREALLEELPAWDGMVDGGLIRCVKAGVEEEHTLVFEHERFYDASAQGEKLPENRLPLDQLIWDADIRDRFEKLEQRRQLQRNAVLWKAIKVAGLAAALLIGLEAAAFAFGKFVGAKEEEVMSKNPMVFAVEGKRQMLNTLEQFTSNGLDPFSKLTALNRHRPDSIYFSSASGRDANQMNIDGYAPTMTAFNAYTQALENSGLFDEVKVENFEQRQGQVDFELSLTFRQDEQARAAMNTAYNQTHR